jgi:hypothetical protein
MSAALAQSREHSQASCGLKPPHLFRRQLAGAVVFTPFVSID